MAAFEAFIGLFQTIIKGLLIGICASAPMGPVGILCIQRTMRKGRAYGLATGAGAALSDLIYALFTGLGLSFFMAFIENEATLFWLKLIGSAMLFLFGLWTLRSDPKKIVRPPSSQKGKGTLLQNFVTSFLLTFSNPLIIFLFIALFNMLTFVIPKTNYIFGMLIGYVSIVCGAMLWWYGLTYVLTKAKGSFGARGIYRLNQTIGWVVVVVAVGYAADTIFHLSFY